jgi:signal recognition particle receptor subunit beta
MPNEPFSPERVAMDFGRITLDDHTALYLFGMPEGRRFDFMWEILSDGFLGFVVMLDSSKLSAFRETKSILETFRAYAPTPYVIAANFQDSPDAWSIADLRIALHIAANVPIIPCVATERESVKRVILALLEKVVEAISEAEIDD